MKFLNRRNRFYFRYFLRHDLKASITVFFVALPLCLGISHASGTPVYSGLLAGIIGGLVVSVISGSNLSVSGPAAGLTAISAASIEELGDIQLFFYSVALAGLLQIIIGVLRFGGFTQFIPSAVIKGMLAAIGILLISKQIPLVIGYDQPDFWTGELLNIIRLNNAISHIGSLYQHSSMAATLIAAFSFLVVVIWEKVLAKKLSWLPSSFLIVLSGVFITWVIMRFFPSIQLKPSQFVSIPANIFPEVHFPRLDSIATNKEIWKNAFLFCFVASLETLLSTAAIDKIDPYNRITPQNRELVAQGTGNFFSGLLGGLPITAVIVRSSANAEAGAKSRLSAFMHGLWLLLVVLVAVPLVNMIPYCVLAVILIRTGYNLAKPKMIMAVYRQGREQWLPFLMTAVAILLTDLLIGVFIGIAYSIYFLIKHTFRAGYTIREITEGHTKHITIELALNVSFLNKKKISNMLDSIPAYSVVDVNGSNSVYIDHDILEIFQDFKSKAHNKHIQLTLRGIPEVETIELH